ncbi:hypothetical protein M2333_000202 [Sphingobium sp. B11D3B]|uniref:hypothetical protein n=1 Tax=Sphingobium sp. B11D3B TaxID=2940575 RepID=UPI002226A2F3|nr:hypothetical protein [Sphingobium sp. B11D3B]MCW2387156.1 hypothetical protein [Sphingobium sp. B11D3B]
MFDRMFQKAIGIAARLLFAASLMMVVWGCVYAAFVVTNFGAAGPTLLEQAGWLGASLSVLQSSFVPAAQLFCGSVIIHYLELWMAQREGS